MSCILLNELSGLTFTRFQFLHHAFDQTKTKALKFSLFLNTISILLTSLFLFQNIDKIPLVECPVLVIHVSNFCYGFNYTMANPNFCQFEAFFWCLQGTEDEVVDFSHGKQLWELCKEKYEPLWLKGGNHCNLELYPEYLRHLGKFISAIEKLPRLRNVSEQSSDQQEKQENQENQENNTEQKTEKLRPSTDHKEQARPSTGHREKSRLSTDSREKSRTSTDKREKSRKSVDRSGKARNSIDHPERARNSFDRSVITTLQEPVSVNLFL